jgi:hypothetical protein
MLTEEKLNDISTWLDGDTRLRSWLNRYATSRKVAGFIPDEVIEFFSIYLILPADYGPGVDLASNRNEYQ